MSPEAPYLYLTTIGRRSGRPRQIEIWFKPAVRARIGRRSFRGHARVVDGRSKQDLVATIRERSEAKYGWGAGLVVEIAPAARRRRAPRR